MKKNVKCLDTKFLDTSIKEHALTILRSKNVKSKMLSMYIDYIAKNCWLNLYSINSFLDFSLTVFTAKFLQ